MEYGIIKNYDIIQDDCKVEDLLDFSESIDQFTKKLNSIERSSIVGLIGKFGSGKSTMLYQIKNSSDEEKQKWIDFDAWKYPERKDLWEGFVLDFADQVGEKKKVKGKIDGKDTKSRLIGASTDLLTIIIDKLPNLGFMEKFLEIFRASPAKRVFEIQEILKQLVNSQKKEISIIIEDIDRSGDAGIYFLETLKQFIREGKFENRIIAIVPIGDENFSINYELYLKCLDYIEYFNPKFTGLSKFVRSIFKEDLLKSKYSYPDISIHSTEFDCTGQVSTFFDELFKLKKGMTIRTLKNIIRESDLNYISQVLDGHRPDWRVTLCFQASKYLNITESPAVSWFDKFRHEKQIYRDTIFASFLASIVHALPNIYDPHSSIQKIFKPKYEVKCIERNGPNGYDEYPSQSWIIRHFENEEQGYGVCDFYLEY